MTNDIENLLRRAKGDGISFSVTDPNLAEVKRDIAHLRKRGWSISQKVEAEPSFSPFKRKRIRFIMESEGA